MTPARKLTHNTKFECFWMQKDNNFGNAMILHHFGPEKCQKSYPERHKFQECHDSLSLWAREMQKKTTQKDTNFGNAIILCYLGPENRQNPTQKDMNFKLHSLTPAKMPTNKESIRFSRNSHHI